MLLELTSDTTCAGLIVDSGKPDVFIAGADLKFLGGVPASGDPGVRELMEFGLATLALLEDVPFPTCAVIAGAALGGGLEVALACDYRLVGANPKVELGLPEVTLGLIPGWGGTQRLPRIVGVTAAIDMMMTGKSVGGAEAIRSGLADGQVGTPTPEELFASGHHPGRRSTKRDPVPESDLSTLLLDETAPSIHAAISTIVVGWRLPLGEALKLETAAFVSLAGSDGSRRRIAEFFAARKR